VARIRAALLAGFDAGFTEGWDSAIDALTAICDADILHGSPEVVRLLAMRKNLQSLRKVNPGGRLVPEDTRQAWDEHGNGINPPGAGAEAGPPGPAPPKPELYTSVPGGTEEAARLQEDLRKRGLLPTPNGAMPDLPTAGLPEPSQQ
jgi:hypothetical protein